MTRKPNELLALLLRQMKAKKRGDIETARELGERIDALRRDLPTKREVERKGK